MDTFVSDRKDNFETKCKGSLFLFLAAYFLGALFMQAYYIFINHFTFVKPEKKFFPISQVFLKNAAKTIPFNHEMLEEKQRIA